MNPAVVGLDHLHQQPHHGARRVELPALPAFGEGELLEEVLVDLAQHIGGLRLGASHLDVAYEVDDLPEPVLVERGPRVVLGQHTVERRVVALDRGHRAVYQLADGGLAGLPLQVRPARLGRHPEDAPGGVLVPVSPHSASTAARRSSKASETYLRKMSPSTTCLYSAASMLPRSASAIRQRSDR